MLKKYIAAQLTQISAYLGVFMMVAALFHLPYFWIFIAGLALLLTDDEWCQKKMSQWSPTLKKILES